MIQWWQPDDALWLLDTYAAGRGKEIAHHFKAVGYKCLTDELRLDARAHMFSGLDQLSSIDRRAVEEVWDRLAAERPGVKLLNDPRRIMTRFVLLEKLYEKGLNNFRVYRATDVDQVTHYPVFVRSDRRHDGSLTGLINDVDTLRQSIRALRARGEDLDDLMIVEYVDARDSDGLYRKYAAFRVGDRVLPSHVIAHTYWMVKSEGGERSLKIAHDEERFQAEGEFNDWIRRVFDLAGIDYGRLDFGVVNGKPQAWEINMHPTVGRGRGGAQREQDEIQLVLERVRSEFHAKLRDAFAALDDESIAEPEPLTIRIDEGLRTALDAQHRAEERRSRLRKFLARVYHAPSFGRPLRWAYKRLLPRR